MVARFRIIAIDFHTPYKGDESAYLEPLSMSVSTKRRSTRKHHWLGHKALFPLQLQRVNYKVISLDGLQVLFPYNYEMESYNKVTDWDIM